MAICDGCGTSFDESVELYPRLVITKEAQVARKLAEKENEEMLCLGCWLEATDGLDKKQLAMLLLAMLGKINTLEKALQDRDKKSYPDFSDIVEKSRKSSPTQPSNPWVSPVSNPPFIYKQVTTCGYTPMNAPKRASDAVSTPSNDTVYVCGQWSDKLQ